VKTNLTQEDLAGLLYDSLHSKIMPLADEIIVYPGHGAGSQCGKNLSKETFDTLGNQKKTNYALQPMSKADFVKELTTGLMAPPAYFPENAKLNKYGYESIDEVMTRNAQALTPQAFQMEVESGAYILDTRNPEVFEQGFVPGAVNVGLNGQYAVWVGTVVPFGKRLVLVLEPGKEAESILRLARVGYDNVAGYLSSMDAWQAAGMPVDRVTSISADGIRAEMDKGAVVVDVRNPAEFESSHIAEAMNLPLADLNKRLSELKPEQRYVIHCAGGYRSMIAASILKEKGYTNIVNVSGGFNAIRNQQDLNFADGLCPSQQRAERLGM
jgi:rhodanese-related sulfurtransferase